MQIQLNREALLKPLGLVASVVERRHPLPILGNVLLRLVGDRLSLVATDLEVELKATVAAEGQKGEAALPARKLLDICRALPAEASLDLRIEKEKAIIKSGRSRFTLATLPAAEFPNIETEAWLSEMTLPQRLLRGLLEDTAFCMAQQDVRYYLNGLLLEVDGNDLRSVATDGHRLAYSVVALDRALEPRQVIIPRKGVQEAMRFLESTDAPVQMQIGANHIRFSANDVTLTSKLIDGRFPDYHKVIPRSQSKRLVLSKELLRETLSRVAILSNEKYRGVRLSLAPGTLRVTAHNPEQEEASEDVPVVFEGGEMEIGFNVSYLLDAVGAVRAADVVLGLNDPDSSGTIQAESGGGIYVVMPMRL